MGQSKRAMSKWQKFRQQDAFVREASRLGVRSRSYFKLEELDRRFDLLKPGMLVLDLGASPGGWSQYALSRIGVSGQVYATDIIGMIALHGVHFTQCDISSDGAVAQLTDHLEHRRVDVILSDMAPNITGNALIDARNYSDLYAAIFEIRDAALADSGALVFKFFSTGDTLLLKQNCHSYFDRCKIYKPKSSRSKSQESYMVARGFRPQHDGRSTA